MTKDSRLSFRISPKASSRIDLAVRKSGGEIKDRSELGTKAVEFYLRHVLASDSDTDLMCKILLSIADRLQVEGHEIQKVRDLLYDDPLTPLENHPKFEDLMVLRELLPRGKKREFSKILFSAKYGELDRIYERYSKIVRGN